MDNNSNHENGNGRDYISSPGYDTSSSTAPASSPDPCEYTYEGAIQDYKSRVSRAQTVGGISGSAFNGSFNYASSSVSKDSTPERSTNSDSAAAATSKLQDFLSPRRPSASKIENRLLNFEIKGASQEEKTESLAKKDLPKVDILKRRELFEKETSPSYGGDHKVMPQSPATDKIVNRISSDFSKSISIKERLSNLEKRDEGKDAKKLNLSGGDFGSVKDRLINIENPPAIPDEKPLIIEVVPLKDRMCSLHHSSTTTPAIKGTKITNGNHLDDQVEQSELVQIQLNDSIQNDVLISLSPTPEINVDHFIDTDREDSGIHTADVSCSVSQNDEPIEEEVHEKFVMPAEAMHPLNVANVPDVVPDIIAVKPQPTQRKEVPAAKFTLETEEDPIIVQKTEFTSLEQESSVSNTCATSTATTSSTTSTTITESASSKTDEIIQTVSLEIVQQLVISVINNSNENLGNSTITTTTTTTNSNTNLSCSSDSVVTGQNHVNIISSGKVIKSEDVQPVQLTPSAAIQSVSNTHDLTSQKTLNTFSDNTLDKNISDKNMSDKNVSDKITLDNLILHNKLNGNVVKETAANIDDEEVVEICQKIDVNTLSDREHIPTPFINVDKSACKNFINNECSANSISQPFLPSSPPPESETIEAKNQRLKCQIVGVLEKSKQEHAALSPVSVTDEPPPLTPSSTRSSCSSKSTKNIFDFIKSNLLNETNDTILEKSTFYVALNEHEQAMEKNDKMVKNDSLESSEVNRFLDEELNKLN